MEEHSVRMGGILDIATTQSDNIFLVKNINTDTSSASRDNLYQSDYSENKTPEPWNDYEENIYNEASDSSNKSFICDKPSKQQHLDQPSDLPLNTSGPMIWSISSSIVETPGDSGVQCLDSETSDLTGDCPPGMTHSLVEADELTCDSTCESKSKIDNVDLGAIHPLKNKNYLDCDDIMTQSDIENQNTCSIDPLNNNSFIGELQSNSGLSKYSDDANGENSGSKPKNMEAVKSASDDIVYRRKCKKKSGSNQSQPKKRVSFHEDILNNTKTDNIHIEHGFISYRPENAMNYFPNNYFKKLNGAIGRYSWCAVGDTPYVESQCDYSNRNTKSDVLTYGRTEVSGYPDDSGIYEYQSESKYTSNKSCDSETCINKLPMCKCSKDDSQKSENNSPVNNRQLYMCSCSSSDSNLSSESETSSQSLSLNSDTRMKISSKKCDNTQKSYSCDCIENNAMKPLMKTMYFSDANINNHSNKYDEQLQMSEVLPKPSCLKKSALKKKRYITTDVIEEHETSRNKGDGEGIVKGLLDSKNLFGSLKNIYKNINFGLSIAERGVPEGSEDCQSVSEVLPSDTFKPTEYHLSKSFDSGYSFSQKSNANIVRTGGDGFSRNYTHEVDDQLRGKYNVADNYNPPIPSENVRLQTRNDVSKQNLSLDMNASNGKTFLDWKSQGNRGMLHNSKWLRNKCIVNCESTVYEHKGVSYCYEYDTFQTTFDTSKDTFTPILDNIKLDESSPSNISNKDVKETNVDVEKVAVNEIDNDKINSPEDETKTIANDTTCDSDSLTDAGDKSKFRLSRYLADQTDITKSGVSKHLSSPLKQKNIMRYEKHTKPSLSTEGKENEPCFDTSSMQDTTVDSGEMDEIMEIGDGFEISYKNTNRKMSLINRFLKNVSQKKAFYSKLNQNEFFQQKMKEESLKFPNICYPKSEKISPNFKVAAKYLDMLINKEVMENKRISVKLMTADEPSYFDSFEENVAIECNEKLKLELFRDPSEILHRMLKVRSNYSQENGQWTPHLVFITNRALYVADVQSDKRSYDLLCYLTHDKLNTIVIGPDSQYVQIFDNLGVCSCIVITGDRYLCHRLVSSLEWSSRNCFYKNDSVPVRGGIPTVYWKNRECLRKPLLNTSSYNKYENCLFYGMVASSAPTSFNTGRSASPFGQQMEGFLMYKAERQRHWKPSFFLLKSGVLSYGSSTLPLNAMASCLPHSIDLKTVIGVRRCTDIHGRPYCFEIALSLGAGVLQMAAPDDDVASQWLQGLLMHAAQSLEGPKSDLSKKMLPPCCTLLATSKHIITLRENLMMPSKLEPIEQQNISSEIKIKNYDESAVNQNSKHNIEILSFASIKDLTALKIPDNDDNWCILEFVYCEVHEGTEMGFLFTSSAELERFIATVESLWHTTNEGVFPISIQPSSDTASGRCSEWHNRLVTAWDKLLPAAQR